ncbi:MAG: CpsD/CapB family tyrosine-protein kinase [Patescibacteria group bacterium]|nr:CpsD/CapB family tyrosine-protein kinase [Patescibacteria group bacterium]
MIGQPALASPVLAEYSPGPCPSDMGEYYRAILRSLHWPMAAEEAEGMEAGNGNGVTAAIRTLGVTSCARGEGVSTVAAHLAAAAAGMVTGNVLLVDANMAHPVVHNLFDVDAGPGLAEATVNAKTLEAYVQPSGCQNLELLTAGEPNGKPRTTALDSAGVEAVLAAVGQAYQLVVFDMPPASGQSATLRLASMLDAVIIVVEAERISCDVARRAKELLQRAGARVRGAVLNKRRDYVPRWLYGRL